MTPEQQKGKPAVIPSLNRPNRYPGPAPAKLAELAVHSATRRGSTVLTPALLEPGQTSDSLKIISTAPTPTMELPTKEN